MFNLKVVKGDYCRTILGGNIYREGSIIPNVPDDLARELLNDYPNKFEIVGGDSDIADKQADSPKDKQAKPGKKKSAWGSKV